MQIIRGLKLQPDSKSTLGWGRLTENPNINLNANIQYFITQFGLHSFFKKNTCSSELLDIFPYILPPPAGCARRSFSNVK